MTEKHTLTVVINVFDDKYCDVYFFTPEQKKWCANLMRSNTFTSFARDSMHYPLFNTKYDNPEKDLKSLVRTYLNAQFGRVHDMNIHSYLDFSQSYSLEPAFDIDDSVMDEVYVCDYCIGNLYGCSDTLSWFYRVPKLYRADEFVCDDDCTFHLLQEELDDAISTVKRCGDELECFAELSLYAIKDDKGIEVCPFSVGNKDYFVQKAREHASDKNYLTHKTYVYEYKNGKTNKIYGCCRFNEASNVVALNLDYEDAVVNSKAAVMNKTTLNVTSNVEQSPYSEQYYIIQAFKGCHWQDVLVGRGDISTAEKKARHYRNQNYCETRVISIKENVSYSYDYDIITKYDKQSTL